MKGGQIQQHTLHTRKGLNKREFARLPPEEDMTDELAMKIKSHEEHFKQNKVELKGDYNPKIHSLIDAWDKRAQGSVESYNQALKKCTLHAESKIASILKCGEIYFKRDKDYREFLKNFTYRDGCFYKTHGDITTRLMSASNHFILLNETIYIKVPNSFRYWIDWNKYTVGLKLGGRYA